MKSEKKERDEEGQKREYRAPILRVVELATDEVLGSGCKSVSDVAPTGLCGTTACGSQVGS